MKIGVFFLLLGIVTLLGSLGAASLDLAGYWNNPRDCFNLIAGIVISVCGVILLAPRKKRTNPLDAVSLDSIGMSYSGRIAERVAVTEGIMMEKTSRSNSDFIPEIAVVKNVGHTRIEPLPARMDKVNEPVESLIEKASSLLTNR